MIGTPGERGFGIPGECGFSDNRAIGERGLSAFTDFGGTRCDLSGFGERGEDITRERGGSGLMPGDKEERLGGGVDGCGGGGEAKKDLGVFLGLLEPTTSKSELKFRRVFIGLLVKPAISILSVKLGWLSCVPDDDSLLGDALDDFFCSVLLD